jgi:hypothetical protein
MSRYFFVIEGPDETHNDKSGTLLPDDKAAVAYAKRIIGELKEAGGYDEPGFKVIVQKHNREVVQIIPF